MGIMTVPSYNGIPYLTSFTSSQIKIVRLRVQPLKFKFKGRIILNVHGCPCSGCYYGKTSSQHKKSLTQPTYPTLTQHQFDLFLMGRVKVNQPNPPDPQNLTKRKGHSILHLWGWIECLAVETYIILYGRLMQTSLTSRMYNWVKYR